MLWLQELKYSAVILQDSVHVFQKEVSEHLFGFERNSVRFRLGELLHLSHSDLLRWVIHSEWLVHKRPVTHLQGMKRRVISPCSSVAHPPPCSSTSGTLTCSNSNNLVLLLQQCEATGPRRSGAGKSFYINDLCLFFRVSVQRKHLAKMFWADDAASKTNVLDRRQRSEWLCVEERKECVCVYLVFCS